MDTAASGPVIRFTARLIAAPIVLTLAACASIGRPVNQELQLGTTGGGDQVEASCELSNDRGRWTVIAPVIVGVTRSAAPLTIRCVDGDGRTAQQVVEATSRSAAAFGSAAAYAYPAVLTLALEKRPAAVTPIAVADRFAAIGDVGRVPHVDDGGRNGYRRFLAGPSPRAFAVSDGGYWVRVNGSRGADRLALDRCQSAGTVCTLYAVDDAVVWGRGATPLELLAAQ